MSMKPNRPAPLPPAKQPTGYKAFDPIFKNDSNNNKTLQPNSINRPTVIRTSLNQQIKKKPPPRPAPPKNVLIRRNATKKRGNSTVTSQTPDLLADLQDIFGPPKPRSYPSPVSSRPALKKNRAPQPQWPKKTGALIDFDAPSPAIRQSSSTPSFRAETNRTLLDEDLPSAVGVASSNCGSLQDLLSMKDPFSTAFHNTTASQHYPFAQNNFNSLFETGAKSVTSHHDHFGGISFTAKPHNLFESSFANNTKVTSSNYSSSAYKASTVPKNDILDSSAHNIKWDSVSTSTTRKEQWSIDQFASPPEPQHPPPPPPPEAAIETEKWCRALYDFEAQTSEELSFSVGDVIFVDEGISADWWRGHLNGKSGLFPANYVEVATANYESPSTSATATNDPSQSSDGFKCASEPSSSCYATALYTFDAEQPGDLNFQEGDVIQVLYRINQDWLFGKFKNKEGQFPSNFVKKLGSEENENKMEVIAGYSFQGVNNDELTFQDGDVIVMVEKVSSDWSKGYLKKDASRSVGHFPTAFTSPIS